ncbi:MAG: DMT family transporter [Thermoleophilia bacterium]|nr:DMT family transporter [Thermoleophilia bacterium]
MGGALALVAAVCWGIGDFLGGLSSKRLHVLTVLLVSQALGFAGLAVWVAALRDPFPGLAELLPALAAGAAGFIGLGALYRGLAIGAMGIVAPISAAGPVIPLAVDLAQGRAPSSVQWLGVALVLVGIAVVSHEPARGERVVAAGVGLALVAASGFGFFFVFLDAASDESVPWAVLVARGSGVVLVLAVVLAVSAPLRPPRRSLAPLAGVGVFDTSANALIAAATTVTAAGVVAVLSSLYPLGTIILARLVLGERLSITRRAGGLVALAGAALVAAG